MEKHRLQRHMLKKHQDSKPLEEGVESGREGVEPEEEEEEQEAESLSLQQLLMVDPGQNAFDALQIGLPCNQILSSDPDEESHAQDCSVVKVIVDSAQGMVDWPSPQAVETDPPYSYL